MSITTHVLDTARGVPGGSIPVTLEVSSNDGSQWDTLATAHTDSNGRVSDFGCDPRAIEAGVYRLRFDIDAYLEHRGFYPYAEVVFKVEDPAAHYHVPLLLSPFGYSTYRGS